jgi:hypothetical protein
MDEDIRLYVISVLRDHRVRVARIANSTLKATRRTAERELRSIDAALEQLNRTPRCSHSDPDPPPLASS